MPYLLGAAGVGLPRGRRARRAGRRRGPVRGLLACRGRLGPGTGAGLAADRLSGLFLVIAFGAAVAGLAGVRQLGGGPGRPGRRGLGASYALALGAVAVVLTARDAFTLLFAWETLTLAFYLLSGFERARPGRPAAALVTLAFGRVSGAALLAGLLLLAARSGSLRLAGLAHVPAARLAATAQVLLLAGFAVKVGLVPFQVWLPRGYAAAPGPARAIMAGWPSTSASTGCGGRWPCSARRPAGVTGVLLVLAGLTAVLGIAHAAVQTSLQRVIAYSSVENSGLILAGFGVALVGAASGDQHLLAVGLLAATLQVVAHTAAKSLLFTASAGRWTAAGGTTTWMSCAGSARRRPGAAPAWPSAA